MPTPIRVRGRRKKPWSPSDGVPKPIPSGPKGGRPMLSPDAIKATSQARSSKRARLLAPSRLPPVIPQKRLSRLETLPVELIEKIFLYSLNVNLPRCSRSLCAVVSSERIYRALTLLAFWDDSPSPTPTLMSSSSQVSAEAEATAAEAARKEISRLLRPLDYVPLDRDTRRALQTSVLRCRWCTMQRLLNQLPNLMRLTIHRHWLDAGIYMTGTEQERLRLFLTQEEDIRIFQGTDKHPSSTITDDDDDDVINHYTLTITPLVSITITCTERATQSTHRMLSILEIPDKLLTGAPSGFSNAHVRFLETLRVAAGLNRPHLLEPDVSLSREAVQRGIHTALIEHNAAALTVLLKIDEYTFRCENTPVAAFLSPDESAAATHIPYVLPPEHFRTAVRVAPDDPRLFQLLLRASAESVPGDDAEITQWAMDLGGAFGGWLLDFMVRLPGQVGAARRDPVEAAVFYLGRANGRIEMGRRYLSEVLGVEEVSGWMEEVSYDVSGEWMGVGG